MKTSSETISDLSNDAIFSFDAICNADSRLLILGTMASPASLRAGMYYGHPQNAFWRVLSTLAGDTLPQTNEEKRNFLLRHGIALWDTLQSCEREGALDSNIKNAVPNDVQSLIAACPEISAVFLNGSTAYGFYQRYFAGQIALPYYKMPSTSPANARGGFEAKYKAWSIVRPYMTHIDP